MRLLDFEQLGGGPAAWDLAFFLCSSCEADRASDAAVLKAYQRELKATLDAKARTAPKGAAPEATPYDDATLTRQARACGPPLSISPLPFSSHIHNQHQPVSLRSAPPNTIQPAPPCSLIQVRMALLGALALRVAARATSLTPKIHDAVLKAGQLVTHTTCRLPCVTAPPHLPPWTI